MRASAVGSRFLDRCADSLGVEISLVVVGALCCSLNCAGFLVAVGHVVVVAVVVVAAVAIIAVAAVVAGGQFYRWTAGKAR